MTTSAQITVLATETATATAGREGRARSADGKIDLQLSPPGSNGPGSSPEQLFAAGYAACFGGAVGLAAKLAEVGVKPADIKVTATVKLNKDDSVPLGSGFFIGATLNVEIAGVEQAKLESLVSKAHTICPYSKATRGNVEVKLQANGKDVRGS